MLTFVRQRQGEIWAYGLRNPWQFAFDKRTGDLWVGDVGQNNFEEINIVQRGDNCGWPLYEGHEVFIPKLVEKSRLSKSDLTWPVYVYEHDERGGNAIIFGGVYYGRTKHMHGHVLFSDLGAAVMNPDARKPGGGAPVFAFQPRDREAMEFSTKVPGVVLSFGEGPDGEFYVLSRNSATLKEHTGVIYKMRFKEREKRPRMLRFI